MLFFSCCCRIVYFLLLIWFMKLWNCCYNFKWENSREEHRRATRSRHKYKLPVIAIRSILQRAAFKRSYRWKVHFRLKKYTFIALKRKAGIFLKCWPRTLHFTWPSAVSRVQYLSFEALVCLYNYSKGHTNSSNSPFNFDSFPAVWTTSLSKNHSTLLLSMVCSPFYWRKAGQDSSYKHPGHSLWSFVKALQFYRRSLQSWVEQTL